MAKDIRQSTGKTTHASKMGHEVPPEDEWRPRSEEPFASPEHAMRGPRKDRPVAIVGASADRTKFGNKAVRAYLADGYRVWPVNPKGGEIEGVEAYRSLTELPDVPWEVALYVHEDQALPILDEIADMAQARGNDVAVVYLPPGVDTAQVVDKARTVGVYAVNTCPITAIGHRPNEFPDS
jgi:predicted CoA-binding protein